MRRLHSRQRSGVVSQQRLRPRRFDSTVKRVPKLRFEPVSFLFLVFTEDIGDKLMRDICDYVFLDYCLLDFQPPDTCGELVMEKCASVMDTT